MRRRDFIAVLGGAASCPSWVYARTGAARVGLLHPQPSPALVALRFAAVREGLTTGMGAGRKVEFESRVGDGTLERLRRYARELVAARLDVIVAMSPLAIAVTREATRTTPIIGIDLETDPRAAGWIVSLARPGGNVSGVFLDVPQFAARCLQILTEAIAGLAQVGVLWDPSTGPYQRDAVETAASAMGLSFTIRAVTTLADVEPTVRSLAAEGCGALLILSSPVFGAFSGPVAEAASAARLPAIMLFPEFVQNGGLITYGPDLQELCRRAGAMARRIIDGEKVAELPIERPDRFSLRLNLRTARALSLDLPTSLLAAADEVIE
jgi:putative ABC transport system substrate-binding protein